MSQYYRKCIPTRLCPMGLKAIPYQCELEYLESTGTQWIDTGLKITGAYSLKISLYEALPTPTSAIYALYGARDASGKENLMFSSIKSYRQWWYGNDNTHYKGLSGSLAITEWETRPSGSTMYLCLNDSTTATTSLPLHTDLIDQNMYLFTANLKGNPTGIQPCKIKNFRIWNASDALVMDLIPVLDNSGVPCMYDKVTRAFFYNRGSGTFNYA